MSYYPDFDPYLIRERNEGMRREVSTYRLEKRLRQNREPAFRTICRLRLQGHAAAAAQSRAGRVAHQRKTG